MEWDLQLGHKKSCCYSSSLQAVSWLNPLLRVFCFLELLTDRVRLAHIVETNLFHLMFPALNAIFTSEYTIETYRLMFEQRKKTTHTHTQWLNN